MTRCDRPALLLRRRDLGLACAGVAFALVGAPLARAQDAEAVRRYFPANALRGKLVFGAFPEILLNGVAARLSPGARIRGQDNLLLAPGAVTGQTWTVHYTVEINGLVQDVWILRTDELANKPWPGSLAEAQAWSFDPAAQTWTKP